MQIQPLRGTQSLYPADMRKRNAFANASREVLELAGYEEYEAPILEPFALYEAKSSAEIVERQSYVFTDRGGERIVVRPELTPSLARMVANKQGVLPPLLRWFSFADCWRYERPQKGRSRNFMQLNVDFLGSDSVEADVEAIDLALSIVRANGMDMSAVTMRVNDRASFAEMCTRLNIDERKRGAFLTLLDEREKLSTDEFMTQVRGIRADITEQDLDGIDGIPPSTRLSAVMEAVAALGWTQLTYDPSLIRGFSYYTGVVFEVVATSGDYRRAMFGGGRYDNLLQAVGGKPMSAVGFGVSDVSFFAALESQGSATQIPQREQVLVLPFSSTEAGIAGTVARRLRAQGRATILAVPPYELKRQLTLANRLGITRVVILAPKELAEGKMIEKDMVSGEQNIVPIPA